MPIAISSKPHRSSDRSGSPSLRSRSPSKSPGNVIRALRRYAAANDLTLSEVVRRAIEALVVRVRRDG
jgi:hypothetical protein